MTIDFPMPSDTKRDPESLPRTRIVLAGDGSAADDTDTPAPVVMIKIASDRADISVRISWSLFLSR